MEKLLWIDMEMTGLDVEKEKIIEVAAIVTDMELNVLDQYQSVVNQPQELLDAMDEWNTKQHNKSGLVEKISSAPSESTVESETCAFVKKHFPKTDAILCGNSIGQDRKFIDRYMKGLSSLLHYRMLDVTAWKILMGPKFGVTYEKKESHRALDDIIESIEELKTFVQFIETKDVK